MKMWLAALLATLLCVLPASGQEPVPSPSSPPEHALISDVPYISYADAIKMDYTLRDSLNPSFPASVGMVLQYYGQSLKLLKDWDKMIPEKGGWAAADTHDARGLDELKAAIARGEPVVVMPALTPVAHPFYMFEAFHLGLGDKAVEVLGPIEAAGSGVCGRFAPFTTFTKFKAAVGPNGPNLMHESATIACRVLIGYDDTRRVVVLHDPFFGPAREMGYDDFERMWGANTHQCITFAPRKGQDKRPSKGAPYRALTPDEQASYPYLVGYALVNTGRAMEAMEMLQKAAAVPGISTGRKHVILLELGCAQHELGRHVEALATLEKASFLVPESPVCWTAIAHVSETVGGEGWREKSSAARERAESLAKDKTAAKKVAELLPVPY